jgi:hypothetical protein
LDARANLGTLKRRKNLLFCPGIEEVSIAQFENNWTYVSSSTV